MSQKLRYFIIYKPFGFLSQFTDKSGSHALSDIYDFPPDVYPAGRLDRDSEGLLILTNDKKLNHMLLDPQEKHKRTYLVQVEGSVTNQACKAIDKGIEINIKGKIYKTRPAESKIIPEPDNLPKRIPPIRFRKNIPTSWLELILREGKNRQVRKMTAFTGFPTLRLIRIAIEDLVMPVLNPGLVIEISHQEIYKKLRL